MARSFKILDPELATNLITNPSFETNLTGWTTIGGATAARSTTNQRRGVYSAAITPSASTQGGYSYGPTTLTSGQSYTIAADILGYSSVNYELGFFTTAGVMLGTATDIVGSGEWARSSATYASTGTQNALIYIRKDNDASTQIFYIDGAQCVNLDHDTSYIDGDQEGFLEDGYYWNGTPHASKSTRAAQERSGGQEKDLETLGFIVSNPVGTGMPPVVHHTQGLALLPGAEYVGYKIMPRIIELTGPIAGPTTVNDANLLQARKDIIELMRPDEVKGAQPFILRGYTPDSRGPINFRVVYDSGLEFNTGAPTEEANIRLIGYDPLGKEDGQEGVALTVNQSVSNADYVMRKNAGTWANISTDFNGVVRGIAIGSDGKVYLGGGFINVGDANGNRIVQFDPIAGTLTSLSTGANGVVYAVKKSPIGDIYLGGAFTDLGDVSGDRIAYWDISASAFVSLAASIDNGDVYAIEWGLDGTLYVGGTFTNVIDANGDYCTKWNGTLFSSMGTGASSNVNGIATHPDGNVYFVGLGTFGGGSSTGIAYWDGSAWNDVSAAGVSGGTPAVNAIAIDKNGLVYIGGNFTTAGGVSCSNIAVWNGSAFEALGAGVNNTVNSILISDDGDVMVGGIFSSAGGITVDGFAVWNGSTWRGLDVDLPGALTVYSIAQKADDLYIGYDTSGTAVTSEETTATNNGTSQVYPVITIKRSGGTSATVQFLKNETTGAEIYLNYALLDGETLTLDFRPGKRTVKSDMFGFRWDAILQGSRFTDFFLQPGANNIELYVAEAGAPTTTALMWWDKQHWSIDGIAS